MIVERYGKNPLLVPDKKESWQAQAVFNGCPINTKEGVSLVYRALSYKQSFDYINEEIEVSSIGISNSKDGFNFSKGKKFISPGKGWDRFGCEDPRVTKFGNKYYIFYTALSQYPFNANGIKVAVAVSKDMKKVDEKHLVTPFNAKAMALFPEKINGKVWGIFSFHTDVPPTNISLVEFDKIEDFWGEDSWRDWYRNRDKYFINLKRSERDHVEVGAPPIKTDKGWLLFYSYIKNYFGGGEVVFGIEAVLLDLKNPQKILGRTHSPILVPEEKYELEGVVPNIVFPSGAVLKKDKIHLYYGGADTNCSVAIIDFNSLMDEMLYDVKKSYLSRYDKNPILSPSGDGWESKGAFNPTAVYSGNKVHLVYRALSGDNTSVMGYATSKNGFDIDYKSDKPCYVPREDFEKKKEENANSGCEDGRLTKIGDEIYMLYTAYDSIHSPRVALTHIKEKDFLDKKWNWSKPVLISPEGLDDKDACLFPEKINGKYYILHRLGNGIDISSYKDLDFSKNKFLEETGWMEPRKGFWDSIKIGISAAPIKTSKGWLVLYHGISDDHHYNVGAFLLDLKNPKKILSRTNTPILKPEKDYEKNGIVPNVVFPCGAVVIKNKLFVYYGGADKVVGVAKVNLNNLLDMLYSCRCENWKK